MLLYIIIVVIQMFHLLHQCLLLVLFQVTLYDRHLHVLKKIVKHYKHGFVSLKPIYKKDKTLVELHECDFFLLSNILASIACSLGKPLNKGSVLIYVCMDIKCIQICTFT